MYFELPKGRIFWSYPTKTKTFSPGLFTDPSEASEYVTAVDLCRKLSIQWAQFQPWCRYPWMRWLLPGWSGYAEAKRDYEKTVDAWRELVAMHQQRRREDNNNVERADFIDGMLEYAGRAESGDWTGRNMEVLSRIKV